MIHATSSTRGYLTEKIGISATSQSQLKTSKIRDAATQFEAILIASLLEKFESMAESPGGCSSDAGGSTMHAIGLQALACRLADSGVLGITGLLVNQLNRGTSEK